MFKTIEGIYRDGKVELTEIPGDIPDPSRVMVTFLEPHLVDLKSRGIEPEQAADLRARLATFAEEWESPEMDIYDDYAAAQK